MEGNVPTPCSFLSGGVGGRLIFFLIVLRILQMLYDERIWHFVYRWGGGHFLLCKKRTEWCLPLSKCSWAGVIWCFHEQAHPAVCESPQSSAHGLISP